MKTASSSCPLKCAGLIAAFVLGAVATTAQTTISITNFNFETGGLSDGNFSNSPGAIPSGWSAVGSITGAFYGYFNPTNSSYSGTTGSGTTGTMSGQNIFYFGSAVTGEGIQQTLATNFAVDTNYTLTVALGTRAGNLANTASLTMTLLAGSSTLATTTVRNTTADSFSDFTLNYTYFSGDASLAGQALKIRFTEDDSVTTGEVDIDNVRLTSAIPEPATTATVFGALALAGVVLRRRFRRTPPIG